MGIRIGLFGAFDGSTLADRLARRVLSEELHRRLSGAHIRTFATAPRSAWWDGGVPPEANASPPKTVQDLADQLDCLVVRVAVDESSDAEKGQGPDAAHVGRARELFELVGSKSADRRPIVWLAPDESSRERLEALGVEGEVYAVPDFALLAPQVFSADLLDKRLRYLRLMSWYPPSDPVLVVQGDCPVANAAPTLARAIGRAVETTPDLRVAVVELGGQETPPNVEAPLYEALRVKPYGVPGRVSLEDLIAAIAAGTAFVGHSVTAHAVALAFGKHAIAPDVPSAAQLNAIEELGKGSVRLTVGAGELEDVLQTVLDKSATPRSGLKVAAGPLDSVLAAITAGAKGTAQARTDTGTAAVDDGLARRTSELEARLRELEQAYDARGERLVAERLADADVAWELRTEKARLEARQVEVRAQWKASVERQKASQDRLEVEMAAHAETRAELDRIRATRTFRYTAGARRIYSALRRRFR